MLVDAVLIGGLLGETGPTMLLVKGKIQGRDGNVCWVGHIGGGTTTLAVNSHFQQG